MWEEERARRKGKDAKRDRSFEGSSSKNTLEIQDKPRFEKWVSNQVSTEFPNV